MIEISMCDLQDYANAAYLLFFSFSLFTYRKTSCHVFKVLKLVIWRSPQCLKLKGPITS